MTENQKDYVSNYLKYWPVVLFIGGIISTWAVFGVRLAGVEARQDRQADTIRMLQGQVTDLGNDISGIKAKIESINDNVNYIRDRIDRAVK